MINPPILDFNYETNYGTLFDTRDGQSYPVVRINNQIWLAENFRYLPSIKEKGDKYENSWVYNNDNSYLDKGYGRFYDWTTANNIAPEGWELPNDGDFQELLDFIIKDNDLSDDSKVGNYLKSINGWELCEGIVNTDKYGFNAKPAGFYRNANFYGSSYNANFWSSTTDNKRNNSPWNLNYYNEVLSHNSNFKGFKFSVRLIKDSL